MSLQWCLQWFVPVARGAGERRHDRPSAALECADDGQLRVPNQDEQLELLLRLLVGLRDALGACIIVGAGAESPDSHGLHV